MADNDFDDQLLEALRRYKMAAALSQRELAGRLGVSQGHLSKILDRRQPISDKLRLRMNQILAELPAAEFSDFEAAVLEAIRRSKQFRTLVVAALQLHRKA